MDTVFGCIIGLALCVAFLIYLAKGVADHENSRAAESEKAWQAQEAIWKKLN